MFLVGQDSPEQGCDACVLSVVHCLDAPVLWKCPTHHRSCCAPLTALCPPGSSGKALSSPWEWMTCGQWGSRTPLKKLLPGQKESGRIVRAEPSSEYLIWRAHHGLSWAVLDDLFQSWKHRTNFCERGQFLMSFYTRHGMRPSVRYSVIFLEIQNS